MEKNRVGTVEGVVFFVGTIKANMELGKNG